MDEAVKRFATKSAWVAIGTFIVMYLLLDPLATAHDLFGCAGEAITVTMIAMTLYEKWLWALNPLERTPRLAGVYDGVIEYNYDGRPGTKHTSVCIQQSLLGTSVSISTDETSSSSIVSRLVLENGQHVLYYNYITNPKSKYSMNNPIQYGTCRLTIVSKTQLGGTYWTSRQTIGDIRLTRRTR